MKKNVFSRTLAVLASTVVLGAASMVTANAAGASLSLSNEEGKPGETVYVYASIACDSNLSSNSCGVSYDGALTTEGGEDGAKSYSITSNVFADENSVSLAGYSKNEDGTPAGVFAQIPFTIPEDATPGTVYNITWGEVEMVNLVSGDGTVDVTADTTTANGSITVVGDETDAPTEAPTEAPATEAPATEAPTAAATTAKATVKATKTGAPKTGVTGVAVAVAGLVTAGATAVVLKKRH